MGVRPSCRGNPWGYGPQWVPFPVSAATTPLRGEPYPWPINSTTLSDDIRLAS